MFRHIIFFKFKSHLTEEHIATIFEQIANLKMTIPGIFSFSWGKNTATNKNEQFDYCFVMDFESQQAREEYQYNAKHIEVVEQYVEKNYVNATVFDYPLSC